MFWSLKRRFILGRSLSMLLRIFTSERFWFKLFFNYYISIWTLSLSINRFQVFKTIFLKPSVFLFSFSKLIFLTPSSHLSVFHNLSYNRVVTNSWIRNFRFAAITFRRNLKHDRIIKNRRLIPINFRQIPIILSFSQTLWFPPLNLFRKKENILRFKNVFLLQKTPSIKDNPILFLLFGKRDNALIIPAFRPRIEDKAFFVFYFEIPPDHVIFVFWGVIVEAGG